MIQRYTQLAKYMSINNLMVVKIVKQTFHKLACYQHFLFVGGGLEIALSCDIRIAAKNVKMGLVETKLAIMPGAGGTQLLPRVVTPAIAKELIFTAKIFDGSEAESLGIVNHAYDQNEEGNVAFKQSLLLAEKILPNGPLGIKMAKRGDK